MTVTAPGKRWSGSSPGPGRAPGRRQTAVMCPDCALRCPLCPASARPGRRLVGADEADRAAHAGAVVGAVAVRHLVQVLLVVVLGEVELGRRNDLGRDLAVPVLGQLLAVFGRRLLRRLALRVAGVEDDRPVLR